MKISKIFILSLMLFTKTSLAAFPDDFSNVVWLETDVSGWAETHDLSVSFSGTSINFNSSATSTWPPIQFGGCSCVGNAWVFVESNGTWYASTFEYMRRGQVSKNAGAVNGSHTKKSKIPKAWQPAIGSKVGFMLSGLIRHPTHRNVSERTSPTIVEWPRDFPQHTGGGYVGEPVYELEPPETPVDPGPVFPDLPVIPPSDPESDVACAMVLCLFGEMVDSGPKQCEDVIEDFFDIVIYDPPKIPHLPKTFDERAKRLDRCDGSRRKEVAEIMTKYGTVIKPEL